MSKGNPLAGLLANYGDSDDDSDDGVRAPPLPPGPDTRRVLTAPLPGHPYSNATVTANASGAVHPAPIPHCRKLYSLLFRAHHYLHAMATMSAHLVAGRPTTSYYFLCS